MTAAVELAAARRKAAAEIKAEVESLQRESKTFQARAANCDVLRERCRDDAQDAEDTEHLQQQLSELPTAHTQDVARLQAELQAAEANFTAPRPQVKGHKPRLLSSRPIIWHSSSCSSLVMTCRQISEIGRRAKPLSSPALLENVRATHIFTADLKSKLEGMPVFGLVSGVFCDQVSSPGRPSQDRGVPPAR